VPGRQSHEKAARRSARAAFFGNVLGHSRFEIRTVLRMARYGRNVADAPIKRGPWWHIAVLLGAGLVTDAGQIILVRLTASNSIDITEAIWLSAGRLPALHNSS
jgi:hypothetical protein